MTRAWAEGASRALFGPSGGATGSREDLSPSAHVHVCFRGQLQAGQVERRGFQEGGGIKRGREGEDQATGKLRPSFLL